MILIVYSYDVSGADEVRRPNIIFILADDLGPGDVGFAGGTEIKTPNIDRIAREGIRFERYYAAAPICSPSRCGLITGQYPARWRITSYLQTRAGNRACGQADYLDERAPALPRLLREGGYQTAHFGKWHLGGGRDVRDAPKFAAYGYVEHAGTWESPEPDEAITSTDWIWAPTDQYKRWERTKYFVDRTLGFLAKHRGRPCFVNLWLDDPHTPWVPFEGAPTGASPANLKAVMERNDAEIGRLLDGVKALGLDENTLIIFTSDNGPLPTFQGLRTNGLRGSKLSLYEGGIRMPMAARWPGRIKPGQVNKSTVLTGVDMYLTLAELAGVEVADVEVEKSDGEALGRAFVGGGEEVRRQKAIYWEYGRNEKAFAYPKVARDRSGSLAIRAGEWKLVTNGRGEKPELYQVEADPGEKENVAEGNAEVVKRLTEELIKWQKSLPR